MGKILRLLTALFIAICFLKGPSMAQNQNLDHGYYAKIQTDGLAWSLRVNDLYVRENGNFGYETSDGNIGMQLQPGRNTVSLLFSPLTGETAENGDFIFELRDGLLIDISIQRIDYATRESREINCVTLRYDMTRNDFVAEDKTAAGMDRVMVQPSLRTDGKFTISDLPPRSIVFKTGETIGGYRLDFMIEVDDEELPPFHWREEDAVQLEDSPATRKELMQAYQRLHDLIARGDKATILREARPVWERTAFILTSDASSAEEFVGNTELGLDMFNQRHPDGSELQDLRMKTGIESAALQFMDGGRLVRIRPDPIIWALPPGSSKDITSVFPVVFYKSESGEWRIAEINVGL
ncbi:hypothetical protein [Paracoccus methylarcula]|uniref:Uncharacterized protein n=1 Tax=Paracoccus methylarcula TaxID=72022 RepID=A0A422QUB5_9RHOB|nr:hypothetical protein [Paracoccus methylarcula]RNF33638.1 hypothetical protein A7A09_016235 [Paracoccus methylarcula]